MTITRRDSAARTATRTSSEIQELGGWPTLAMVERYTHLTPARLRGAIERLEQRGRTAGQRSGEEKEFGS